SAYNIDKPFHPKEEGLVGYLIKINEVIIYHAGDTDLIPEMQKLTGYNQQDKKFIALLPVGGRFTMSAEEAFEAAKIIKPTIAIPIHWGSIIGSIKDAEEFKELCKTEGINVEILEKE
ncbi:Zn-dependent hydrolase, partial [Candidatus Pacearchaeota archaeon CG09_land_8_20_14_0_10_30_9]